MSNSAKPGCAEQHLIDKADALIKQWDEQSQQASSEWRKRWLSSVAQCTRSLMETSLADYIKDAANHTLKLMTSPPETYAQLTSTLEIGLKNLESCLASRCPKHSDFVRRFVEEWDRSEFLTVPECAIGEDRPWNIVREENVFRLLQKCPNSLWHPNCLYHICNPRFCVKEIRYWRSVNLPKYNGCFLDSKLQNVHDYESGGYLYKVILRRLPSCYDPYAVYIVESLQHAGEMMQAALTLSEWILLQIGCLREFTDEEAQMELNCCQPVREEGIDRREISYWDLDWEPLFAGWDKRVNALKAYLIEGNEARSCGIWTWLAFNMLAHKLPVNVFDVKPDQYSNMQSFLSDGLACGFWLETAAYIRNALEGAVEALQQTIDSSADKKQKRKGLGTAFWSQWKLCWRDNGYVFINDREKKRVELHVTGQKTTSFKILRHIINEQQKAGAESNLTISHKILFRFRNIHVVVEEVNPKELEKHCNANNQAISRLRKEICSAMEKAGFTDTPDPIPSMGTTGYTVLFMAEICKDRNQRKARRL